MIVKTLLENTRVSKEFKKMHGLCLYIETTKHKILFDLGADGKFIKNAKKLGVDIKSIDTVVISHGHIDHGGGLKHFLRRNKTAKIYIRENAFDKHYSRAFKIKFNIGLKRRFKKHPQIELVNSNLIIDDELTLITNVKRQNLNPMINSRFTVKKGKLDDFSHEQNLIINDNHNSYLFCGCAHCGITNILCKAKGFARYQIKDVIGGFHLYYLVRHKQEDNNFINITAYMLKNENINYYTGHCTGLNSYEQLKLTLGDRINYISTGSVIEI
ncbi:MAG: MBL fold metallo-hydrolase [Erysipelotrichaceae bacterium]|nr:MBL fold metallo-hydrolase [Erysipelotrichaceae bacterium]